eukprot:TRINITY_DN3842_c0_g1_i3.p1 TRINITY_DN3842_c0_g1~~TRINITY_DN3842_c0_g1_i3.p1  ORF type:complete len:235 (+),score=81.27 TRINITY_DN3842_c0_g1_i3:91-795(+)
MFTLFNKSKNKINIYKYVQLNSKSFLNKHFYSNINNNLRHQSVLLETATKIILETQLEKSDFNSSYIIDATFGAGGHTRKLLEKNPNISVLAIDRDETAFSHSEFQQMQDEFKDRLDFVCGPFSKLESYQKECKYHKQGKVVSAILFDLGVSSMQLDNRERGFSFRPTHDAPLDMRMSKQQQISAEYVVNSMSTEMLTSIFLKYGQEKFAERIAHSICARREKNPILTTHELIK